jgi:uncharacterized protein (TIGR03435 family)
MAQDAARPAIELPPEVHSIRAAHPVVGMIEAEQPNFPAEITHTSHNDSDWLQMAHVSNRTAMDITSVHVGYELVVAKGGPKLMDYHEGDTVTLPTPGAKPMTGHVLAGSGPYLVCQDVTITELVHTLSGPDRAGRMVVDKTGLTGTYDFTVPMPRASLPDKLQQALADAGVPSVFDGLKQIGLQLVPAKGPIQGIVVDHIERPPNN